MWHLIASVIAAAIAGTVASAFFKTSLSLGMTVVLGLIGGFVGFFLLGLIGIHGSGMIGNTIVSTFGALVTVWAAGKLMK